MRSDLYDMRIILIMFRLSHSLAFHHLSTLSRIKTAWCVWQLYKSHEIHETNLIEWFEHLFFCRQHCFCDELILIRSLTKSISILTKALIFLQITNSTKKLNKDYFLIRTIYAIRKQRLHLLSKTWLSRKI
jgi:hypothetical protein